MQLMGLVFTTAECVEQTNAFCDSIPGTFCRFAAPLGVSYLMTDADYIHIASQYRCVPADVPVSVCLLYCYDPAPLLQRRVQAFWNNSILPHHVKGITLNSEMQPLMDELVSFLVDNNLLYNITRRRDALGLNNTDEQPTPRPDISPLFEVASVPPPRRRGRGRSAVTVSQQTQARRHQQQFEAARRDMHQQEFERAAAEAAQRDRDIQEALPSIESLFHPRNPTSTQPTPERTANVDHGSVTNYYRNRAAAAGTYSQRQAESAARRRETQQAAAQPAWFIDWTKTDVWTCPGPEGTPVQWPIPQMEHQHLWTTINWLVITCSSLYRQYNRVDPNESTPIGLAAKRWLATRPIFRALLQEALRRRLTFPQEVFQYLKEYVLGRESQAVQVSQPWADPAAAYQNQELAGFLDEPIVLPREIDSMAEFGRDFRIIDL